MCIAVCASGDSNCLFNSNSFAYARAPARVQPAGCVCSQPAPAPCNCVNQPGTNTLGDVGDMIGDETDRKFMEELKALCRSQPCTYMRHISSMPHAILKNSSVNCVCGGILIKCSTANLSACILD